MAAPPNILFITDDQHRYDCTELHGRFPVRTPNLARLAREGVWHRAAYSTCPLCMPARCSLVNGLYGHQNGLTRNEGRWPLSLPTMPQALQAAGYRTGAVGKIHVFEAVPEALDISTVHDEVRSLGFDDLWEAGGKSMAWYCECDWTHHLDAKGLFQEYRAHSEAYSGREPFHLPTEDYVDIQIGNRCVDWLRAVETDRPWFLWAGLCSPHPPYDAPAEYLERYPADEQPLPVGTDEATAASWRARRAHYCAMTEIVDEQVGRMLAVLDERGMAENTLVLFVADHGEMLGDHGLAGKCKAHDPSSRVPLFARWPGRIPAGTVSDEPVEIVDLPFTCVEAGAGAAAERLPKSPGRSLLPHWADPSAPHRDDAYSEDGGQFGPPYQMLRDRRWKYVLYTDDREETLFDLEADPDELDNRAADPACAATKDDLKGRLLQRLARTEAPLRD